MRRFRIKHPSLVQLRHVNRRLARQIVEHGPMAYWNGDLLTNIRPYKLRNISLLADDTIICAHCGARLYFEERQRKKWCCGEGSYNVLQLAPLEAPFYNNRIFLQRARAYNDLFAFCAREVPGGYHHETTGLAFFKIEGRMYHQVYNLSAPGQRFTTYDNVIQHANLSRLYIDDGEERRHIAEGRHLNVNIIEEIQAFINATNPFVAYYRELGQHPAINARLAFEVKTTASTDDGNRQRNVTEIHAVLSTDETVTESSRISIWKIGSARPTSLSTLNAVMEPFQYPLLYPDGTVGWHINRLDNRNNKLSQYDYTRCLLLSEPRFSQLGRLSQAWQVDMFARFEEERLNFMKNAQKCLGGLRIGSLNELQNNTNQVVRDIARDETIAGEGGPQAGRIYLPSTFTGSPRYMKVHYQNAMGLVARKGAPTFFLTFTYSATWDEHKAAARNNTMRGADGYVDPATICRIFHIKLQELIRDLRSGAFFGDTVYILYVIEMQKRGLPHTHIVFKIDGDGPVQATDIDSVIRASIPSEAEAGGKLRELVLKHMIHGPCGRKFRKNFPCWDKDRNCCSKFYPRPANVTTHVDGNGFVQYYRDYRNKGFITTIRGQNIEVHDGWVVPYNPALLLKYEAHINLELCSTRRILKYLFKYLMKGSVTEKVTVTVAEDFEYDEIENYVTKRMVGASDACWRLLDFSLTKSEPTTESLPVHLKGRQLIIFRPDQMMEAIQRATSKLIIYFQRPIDNIFDNETYISFYEKYMVHSSRPRASSTTVYEHPDGVHYITARKRGEKVCRIVWIPPTRGELFYLRLLLLSIPCRSYEDLLSRGGTECTTFQQVARHLGLVDDDTEYQLALREASTFMVGPRLRSFFVLLCNLGVSAALLWEQFKDLLCEDHLERNPNHPQEAYNRSLIEIDRHLRKRGSSLIDNGLPDVIDHTTELQREYSAYTVDDQTAIVEHWLSRLSDDQRCVFDYVRSLIDNTNDTGNMASRVIFVDGPGGYGKTQLLRVILAYVRSCRKIALAVATSGIAARNMPGGSTAHSMFVIPIDLGDGTGVWNVSNSSQRGELIRAADLIVFDEAPMAHRYIFEILNRSIQDLMGTHLGPNLLPFGGKIFLCSGDFRQIAPVVEKARTPADVTNVSLLNSTIWRLFKLFHLTTSQRTMENTAYCNFLLQVGNGIVPQIAFGEGQNRELLIPLRDVNYVTSLEELIEIVFPVHILDDPNQSATRAILAPLIANVKEVNELILNSLEGNLHELLSADSVSREGDNENDGLYVDIDLLHQATAKGVPDHNLRLKIGSVCLIMRNLNISDGLVNGTKVIIVAISSRLITVKMPGDEQLFGIPRISFKFALAEGSPLQVLRRQFPLMLAYAMSGHKSQGQTIDFVGIDLRTDCFTHGQLYVLLSRVRSPNDLVVFVPEHRIREGIAYVKNIVYRDLLSLL